MGCGASAHQPTISPEEIEAARRRKAEQERLQREQEEREDEERNQRIAEARARARAKQDAAAAAQAPQLQPQQADAAPARRVWAPAEFEPVSDPVVGGAKHAYMAQEQERHAAMAGLGSAFMGFLAEGAQTEDGEWMHASWQCSRGESCVA